MTDDNDTETQDLRKQLRDQAERLELEGTSPRGNLSQVDFLSERSRTWPESCPGHYGSLDSQLRDSSCGARPRAGRGLPPTPVRGSGAAEEASADGGDDARPAGDFGYGVFADGTRLLSQEFELHGRDTLELIGQGCVDYLAGTITNVSVFVDCVQ